MIKSRLEHCKEILGSVDENIRWLELKEFNLELEGKFNPDRDQQLEFVRCELECERRRRERVLEEIAKSENQQSTNVSSG